MWKTNRDQKTWILISVPFLDSYVTLSEALYLTEPWDIHEEGEKIISEPNYVLQNLWKGFGMSKVIQISNNPVRMQVRQIILVSIYRLKKSKVTKLLFSGCKTSKQQK